jgi:hypothetical protein
MRRLTVGVAALALGVTLAAPAAADVPSPGRGYHALYNSSPRADVGLDVAADVASLMSGLAMDVGW